jgi:hypothetical protein
MRWDELERLIVAGIKGLKRSDHADAFEIAKIYEGEFQAPWSLPEDYKPGQRYALVQFQTATASTSDLMGRRAVRINGQIGILVGSHATSRRNAKLDVYENLALLRKAMHYTEIELTDGANVTLTWASDNLEFSIPNSVCFMQMYNIETGITQIGQ